MNYYLCKCKYTIILTEGHKCVLCGDVWHKVPKLAYEMVGNIVKKIQETKPIYINNVIYVDFKKKSKQYRSD